MTIPNLKVEGTHVTGIGIHFECKSRTQAQRLIRIIRNSYTLGQRDLQAQLRDLIGVQGDD